MSAIEIAAQAQGLAAKALVSPRLPPANNRVAVLGDSRCFQNTDVTATAANMRADGFLVWSRFRLGQRFDFRTSDNFGVSNDNTNQILARTAPAIAASDAGTWVVLGGTNDYGDGLTFAQTTANLTAIRNLLLAAGRKVIFIAELPRGDSTFTAQRLSSPSLQRHFQLHQWLLDQRTFPGVYVANCWDTWANPTSTTGDAVLGVTKDGLHPSHTGARLISLALEPILSQLFPAVKLTPESNTGLYDATNNPRGWLVSNPVLDGAGGSLTVGTGSIATSWSNTGTNTTGLTLTYSKVTDAAGKAWQQIAITGTAPASAPQIDLVRQAPSSSNYAVGETLEGVAEVEWDAGMSGVQGVSLRAYQNANGQGGADMLYIGNGIALPGTAESGVQRTALWAATATDIRFALSLQAVASATVSATIRVRNMGLRKVL